MKKRAINLELYRCILILMVIILHYNNRGMGGALGYVANDSSSMVLLRFLESACIMAVDGFLLLSGYFSYQKVMMKIPWGKALFLLAATSFYQVVGYVAHTLIYTHDFSVKTLIGAFIPDNWYVCLFVTILLLSPFILRTLQGLSDSDFSLLVGILFLVFSIIPTGIHMVFAFTGHDFYGLSTITQRGDGDGFTIVNFFLCYVVGAYLNVFRKRVQEKSFGQTAGALLHLSGMAFLILYVLCAVILTILSYKTELVWSYANCFVILESVCLFIVFMRWDLSDKFTTSIVGKGIVAISGTSLGVYVWHTTPVMLYGVWVYFNIWKIESYSLLGCFGNLVLSVGVMYVSSILFVLLCQTVWKTIKMHLKTVK